MASRDPTRMFAALSEVLRDSPHGKKLWSGFVEVHTAVFPRAHDLRADLSDADEVRGLLQWGLGIRYLPPYSLPATCRIP